MKAYELQGNLDAVQNLAEGINQWAKGKGFWDEGGFSALTLSQRQRILLLEKSQKILLVVTELAELTEGLRKDIPSSIEGFTNEEEEVADAIIRLFDFAGQYKMQIGDAIGAKMAKNENRPFKHGKLF